MRVGDISDGGLGGYTYDDATTAAVASWLRTKGASLKPAGQPWFLAVNFVNPHDVMYVNSDLPDQNVQGKTSTHAIFRPPHDEIYDATWDDVPLPATRGQPFNAPGRPKGQQVYQDIQDLLVGAWPDEDRRWRLLRNYYYNCIRDCDRQVGAVLDALKQVGADKNTIVCLQRGSRRARRQSPDARQGQLRVPPAEPRAAHDRASCLSRRAPMPGGHLADRPAAFDARAHRRAG
jgi:arylsulfatase A-like enzyme